MHCPSRQITPELQQDYSEALPRSYDRFIRSYRVTPVCSVSFQTRKKNSVCLQDRIQNPKPVCSLTSAGTDLGWEPKSSFQAPIRWSQARELHLGPRQRWARVTRGPHLSVPGCGTRRDELGTTSGPQSTAQPGQATAALGGQTRPSRRSHRAVADEELRTEDINPPKTSASPRSAAQQ